MKIAVVSTGGTIAMAQGRDDKLSSLALDAGDFASELPTHVVGEVSSIVFSKLP
jgi:L-asparaginase/Glu-tRNA(Gln) amidotransferase subunit D